MMSQASQATVRKNDTITHIQRLALEVWPHRGMHWIFEKYGIDWTEEVIRVLPLETWLKLWEHLLETEEERLIAWKVKEASHATS